MKTDLIVQGIAAISFNHIHKNIVSHTAHIIVSWPNIYLHQVNLFRLNVSFSNTQIVSAGEIVFATADISGD